MLQAHQVEAHEVFEAFDDPRFFVQLHGTDVRPGRRFFGFGRAGNGRYLAILFRLFEDRNVFVITARDMDAHEKRKYRRE